MTDSRRRLNVKHCVAIGRERPMPASLNGNLGMRIAELLLELLSMPGVVCDPFPCRPLFPRLQESLMMKVDE